MVDFFFFFFVDSGCFVVVVFLFVRRNVRGSVLGLSGCLRRFAPPLSVVTDPSNKGFVTIRFEVLLLSVSSFFVSESESSLSDFV